MSQKDIIHYFDPTRIRDSRTTFKQISDGLRLEHANEMTVFDVFSAYSANICNIICVEIKNTTDESQFIQNIFLRKLSRYLHSSELSVDHDIESWIDEYSPLITAGIIDLELTKLIESTINPETVAYKRIKLINHLNLNQLESVIKDDLLKTIAIARKQIAQNKAEFDHSPAIKNYEAIAEYIDRKNFTRKIFGEPLIDINQLSSEQFTFLNQSIECELEPERLHQDGERSRAQAESEYRFLTKAQAELETLSKATGSQQNNTLDDTASPAM